jgi:NRPS condensation-like uncharacterized protein
MTGFDMKIAASAVPRRLGAFEHLFAAYGEDGTMNFTVAACVSGMLAEADVIVALAKVQERHTLLRASLAWDENDAHCFVRSDRPIPVSVHSGSAATWHRLAEDEMNKPLVSGEAPLVRVVVALHADSSILLLTFNHAVVDGLAAMFVLREILVALSGGELSAPISTSRLEDHMGLDVPLFSQEKHLRANFNKGNHDHASVSLSGVAIDSVEIDKDHLRRLYLNAKSRGLTLNSVLTAAHGRALVDLNDRWSSVPLRVMSPIDLKPEFAIPEHVGLSLSIAITPFERDRPAFWEDARRVQAQISKFRARNMGIWMVSDLAKRFLDDASYEATRERVVNHIPFDTIMTNLGVLSMPNRYGDLVIEKIWAPALRSVPRQDVVAAATFGDSLSLVHTAVDGTAGLLARIEEILDEAE